MRFVGNARTGVILWALVIISSILVWSFVGLNKGIDFTGGTLLERSIPGQVSAEQVRQALSGAPGVDAASAVIQPLANEDRPGDTIMQIRTGELTNAQIAGVDARLSEAFGDVGNRLTEVVGPVVGSELVRQAAWALTLSALAVLIYLSVRFEYRFALASVLGVTHDVIFVLAALAVMRTEVNMPFIAAILTVVGYSLNNTIIIFDRIRENLGFRKKESLVDLVNKSITQTLGRTIHTTASTLLALLALLIFGGATLRDFTLTLIIGIAVGTVCSLFFAPALWLALQRDSVKRSVQTSSHA